MSGGDGRGPGNTGLGHNGGQPSGNINGSSGNNGNGGNGGNEPNIIAFGRPDPVSGGMGITITSGPTGYDTNPKGGNGDSGSGRDPKYVANVRGWHVGGANTGSLSSPAASKIRSSADNTFISVSFGKEKYQVTYNSKTNKYSSLHVEGGASKKEELMHDQAITVAQLFIINESEKDSLATISGVIIDSSKDISEKLGERYRNVANDIANNIKNFQGKKIRSYNDALNTLNKISSNPNMKISSADKTALANAIKSINAKALADRFSGVVKGLTVADWAIKIEKVGEKTIEGINTGNWSPLVLEVEAMILSGVVQSLAIGVVTAILTYVASIIAVAPIAIAAISFAAIISIAIAVSYIDADKAENFNNTIAEMFKK